MWFHSRSPKAKRRVACARPTLEALEDRLAPAGVLTYLDIDGDSVRITTSKGNVNHLIDAATFSLSFGQRRQLYRLDLYSNPVFRDTDLTITARRADVTGDGIKEGDGLVNVGSINAGGLDLGSVRIEGDLGDVICGDGKAATGAGLEFLSVRSMGLYGTDTQGGGIGGESVVEGALGTLRVKGDIKIATISAGRFGSVRIGGSLIGTVLFGTLFSTGDMASVTIGGDVIGGMSTASGGIHCGGKLVSLTIGGSILGGDGFQSGQIAAGKIVSATIGGDIRGGTNASAGSVISGGKIGRLAVGGSLVGGSADNTGQVLATGNIGVVRIGRDLQGGSLAESQPTLDSAGTIQGDRIGRVFIGGSIIAGIDNSDIGALIRNGSIRAGDDIGSITVRGSLVGNEAEHGITRVVLSARGQETLRPGATTDLAIGSLSVGGRVENAFVLAGFDPNDSVSAGSNGNASIGAVTVGGDWIASNLSAGVQDRGQNGFGTTGDTVINHPSGAATDALVARITSIFIRGLVLGSRTPDLDHFGFSAQQIGSLRSSSFAAALTAGTDLIELSPTTGDVTVREV